MAAGSSAPELATVIIGVFFAKDDIGVSGVIGSGKRAFEFPLGLSGESSSRLVIKILHWEIQLKKRKALHVQSSEKLKLEAFSAKSL